MAPVSLADLHAYHAIDREIFTRLVITLMRDPAESLLVMATWLWLEEKGYPNIIQKMIHLVDPVVEGLAEEVASALKCLDTDAIPLSTHHALMPLTSRLMGCNISFSMFLRNKYTAVSRIKSFLNTVCSRIFTDVLQVALGRSSVSSNQPLIIPGFPHPLFGGVAIFPKGVGGEFPEGGLWAWNPSEQATEDDRTMFLTFSRGFPVTKQEVSDLFNGEYGRNCVVSVQMQESSYVKEQQHQPLFAKMLLDSVETVDKILKGERVAKFRINGKHIWARKYERRD